MEYAEQRDVVLCLENHYKDGTWQYPEFAQPEDIFLEILDRVDSPLLGVQYDPSNALVGGYDPIRFLEKVLPRVVTMHASDRYLTPGATLDELRHSGRHDWLLRQAAAWRNGPGPERLRCDFPNPRGRAFSGWISVEDGMNGLEELRRSIAFLKQKRSQYYA